MYKCNVAIFFDSIKPNVATMILFVSYIKIFEWNITANTLVSSSIVSSLLFRSAALLDIIRGAALSSFLSGNGKTKVNKSKCYIQR